MIVTGPELNVQLQSGKLTTLNPIMIIKAIKTREFLPPKDNLWELLSESIKSLEEKSIVIVTSKVVAIGEGDCIEVSKIDRDKLIMQEAEMYLSREASPEGLVIQTIKNNMLIASAGVDESNGNGYYILWPKDPQKSAKKIWEFLREKFKVKDLAVLITDSRLTPLRQGVVGYAIGFYGFKPIKSYIGKKDLFGREFKMETSNIPDSLASAAVLEMGEGAERQPIAIISDISLEFSENDYSVDIDFKKDMFYPFLSSVNWKKGGSGKKQ